MKLIVKKGSTSKLIEIFIQDSSSLTGGGLTGLVFNTSSLSCYYVRNGGSSATAVTLVTMTLGTWVSGGFKEIDSTNMPGWYQFGIPDAVLATGVDSAVLMFKGAANMAPVPIEIQLSSVDLQDSVRFGLTALPNAAAEAAGGLFTRGTGAGQINQDANGRIDINLKAILGTALTETAGQIAAAFKKVFDVASPVFTAQSVNQTGDSFARLGAPTGASISADIQTRAPSSTALSTAQWTNARATNLDNLDVAVSTRSTYAGGDTSGVTTLLSRISAAITITGGKVDVNDKTGFSLSSAGIQAIWDALTSTLSTANSIGKLLVDNINATISSRLASASYTAPPTAVQNRQEMDSNSTKLANLDATVSSRSTLTAANVWAYIIEGSLTAQNVMRLIFASVVNKLSGAATTTVKIRDLADTKDRITATVDADGNRTAVTVDAT